MHKNMIGVDLCIVAVCSRSDHGPSMCPSRRPLDIGSASISVDNVADVVRKSGQGVEG
jgi:hypothetical protein